MNANDLNSINWTLVNGQRHERIKLLSLISQILELISIATPNDNDRSSFRSGNSTDGTQNTAHLHTFTGNSQVNRRQSVSPNRLGDDDQRSLHRSSELSNESCGPNDNDRSSFRSGNSTEGTQNTAHLHTFTGNSQDSEVASVSAAGSKETSSNTNKTSGSSEKSSFNLNELLQSEICADIFEHYKENGHLDEVTQRNLIEIICNEMVKGPRASNETISRISSDVCMVFVTEDKRQYFDHQPNKCPTGIFYNMYKNKLRKEDKANPPTNSRKRKAEAMNNETDNLDDKIKESFNYLKAVQDDADCADHQMISDHWSASFSYRRSSLRHKTHRNVSQIIEKWPIVKTSYGLCLIKFDFEKLYGPLCAKSMVSNWDDIVRITEDVHNMISKCNTKVRLSIANLPSKDNNHDNVKLAKSLHYLVKPSATSTVQKITPSMEASQKSFYQFATSYEEVNEKLRSRYEYWKLKNIEPHPIIFGIKSDSSVGYVLIMHELQIHFREFLNAFDAAFMMFHFFNIPFPPESVKFWSIVSVLIYNVSTDLHITGKLCTVIGVLKKHIQKAKTPERRSTSSPTRSRSPTPAL